METISVDKISSQPAYCLAGHGPMKGSASKALRFSWVQVWVGACPKAMDYGQRGIIPKLKVIRKETNSQCQGSTDHTI